jgi:hypothetical protein
MASGNTALPTLDPQIYEDWDDEDDLRWKAPLAALLAGTQTPLQAAQAIDTLLRTETSSRLQKLNDYAASHRLTAEDRESGDWLQMYPPNAGALAQVFMRSWCRVCTAFYPYSEGQNRLVNLLEELKGLPRWMAPETRPDEDGKVLRTEFWAFQSGWIGLEDEFRRQRDSELWLFRRSVFHHVIARDEDRTTQNTDAYVQILSLPATYLALAFGGRISIPLWPA